MSLASPRVTRTVLPRKVSSIAFAIGGLASFVIFVSLLLFTHPIGSSVTWYLYGTDTTQPVGFHHNSSDFDTSDPNPSPDSTSSDSPPLTRQGSDDNKVFPEDPNHVTLGRNSGEPREQKDAEVVFQEALPKFDVVVVSSGQWFVKQYVYILNDEIVGGQLWWPDKTKPARINNVEAFGISVEIKAIAKHQNYTGLTILNIQSLKVYK
ncbi:unnamed protein product [Microthlaspi erraticum]|uniref:Uncharacterized protein n=1 Tax=Microthlaspi erraticum TaxID=1685480 RepID=A0A6D2HZ32_9BRAS|nr:unnamed protein product [Microthlaspi erraticum]